MSKSKVAFLPNASQFLKNAFREIKSEGGTWGARAYLMAVGGAFFNRYVAVKVAQGGSQYEELQNKLREIADRDKPLVSGLTPDAAGWEAYKRMRRPGRLPLDRSLRAFLFGYMMGLGYVGGSHTRSASQGVPMTTMKQALKRIAAENPETRERIAAILQRHANCDCGNEVIAGDLDEMFAGRAYTPPKGPSNSENKDYGGNYTTVEDGKWKPENKGKCYYETGDEADRCYVTQNGGPGGQKKPSTGPAKNKSEYNKKYDQQRWQGKRKRAAKEIGNGKNGYVAMYRGKRLDVWANTLIEARELAAREWRVRPNHQYKINVMLAHKDGKQVTHLPLFASQEARLAELRALRAKTAGQDTSTTRRTLVREFEKLGRLWKSQLGGGRFMFTHRVLDDGDTLSLSIWDENDEPTYAPTLSVQWVYTSDPDLADDYVSFGITRGWSGPSVRLRQADASTLYKTAVNWLKKEHPRTPLLGHRRKTSSKAEQELRLAELRARRASQGKKASSIRRLLNHLDDLYEGIEDKTPQAIGELSDAGVNIFREAMGKAILKGRRGFEKTMQNQNALVREELARTRGLPMNSDGWARYRNMSRAGSEYPMNVRARFGLFLQMCALRMRGKTRMAGRGPGGGDMKDVRDAVVKGLNKKGIPAKGSVSSNALYVGRDHYAIHGAEWLEGPGLGSRGLRIQEKDQGRWVREAVEAIAGAVNGKVRMAASPRSGQKVTVPPDVRLEYLASSSRLSFDGYVHPGNYTLDVEPNGLVNMKDADGNMYTLFGDDFARAVQRGLITRPR